MINLDVDPFCKPDVCGDVKSLPFRSEAFQQILLTDVIEHLKKSEESKALNEVNRVLCDNGELILTTPYNKFLYVLLDPAFYFTKHRHYTPSYVQKLLRSNGFNVITIFTSGFFWACMNVMWYCFITYPVKKMFNHLLPYAPLILQAFEDKEYEKAYENGYTLFVKARKQQEPQ